MQSNLDRIVDDYDRGRLTRRQLIGCLAGSAAAAAAAGVSASVGAQTAPRSTFDGINLNHIALRVTDIERSRVFYQKHLGLELANKSQNNCFLRCKDHDFLALFRHDKPGLDHYCFSVKGFEAGDAVDRLKGVGLKPRRRADRVYFDDPDGIEVQVAAKTHRV